MERRSRFFYNEPGYGAGVYKVEEKAWTDVSMRNRMPGE